MNWPRWSDRWIDIFEADGSLRDVYVFDTTPSDWQQVIDALRRTRWASEFREDGTVVPMPPRAEDAFSRASLVAVLWAIRPVPELSINCHFFTPDEVEFDLAPWEVHGQSELDAITSFVATIGDAVGKAIVLCPENEPTSPLCTYRPDTRTFSE